MVPFAVGFHVRRAGDVLKLSGSGHLVPTIRSPASSSFTIAGTATFVGRRAPGARTSRSGTLTLQFSVAG